MGEQEEVSPRNPGDSMRDWDDFWCYECEEWGHPTPGTDEWDEFVSEVDAEHTPPGQAPLAD
jgi:hypothetical protein